MSSVDDLESVDVQVQDAFLETGDMEAERVGCDDESALFADDVYGLLHGQHIGDPLGEEQPDDLSVGGGDLFAHDDLDVVVFLTSVSLGQESAVRLVVIGYADHVHAIFAGLVHLLVWLDHRLGEFDDSELLESGIFRMEVRVRSSHCVRIRLVLLIMGVGSSDSSCRISRFDGRMHLG